jgi:putative ABC transport system ATP-binding protein
MNNALKIQNLRFSRPDGYTLAIEDLEISKGEHTLLCGPSGCGKSTLLNLVAGLLDASSGIITVAGEIVTEAKGARRDAIRGRHIGMVFQTHNLLSGFTAKENLDIALEFSGHTQPESPARSIELLKSLGVDRPYAGIDELSIGEQQRVAVARSLVATPALVLADEPTASLDPKHARETIRLLREATAQEGSALIVSSHDPILREEFDRVIEFEDLIVKDESS